MTRSHTHLLLSAGVLAMFAGTSQAVSIVDDNFAVDGTVTTDADYFASSTSSAIEFNANSIGLVSGSSGRQIHALFDTVTLNQGDSLSASIDFTTPATIKTGAEDFKFGVFDNLGRTSASELGQNTSYNSSNPNPDYSGLFGYFAEIDVESTDPTSDLDIRESDPSNTGRLLSTNSGFTSLGSGPDIGYAITADTDYTLTLTFTRNLADELEVTVDFLGNSLTRVDDTPQSFDFGMLALGSSSGAFGSSNSAGDPDNGIDITNVSVDYTPIPEPGTLALGLLGGLTILARRR
ncbi:MAG: hypothetical protein AAGJ83_10880 [Planctomycetota bacterium]